MAFLRMLLLLLAVLSVVYASAYLFLLSRRREQMERTYQDGARPGERARFVEAAVAAYARRIRLPLALAIYAVPVTGLVVYIWASN